jgi:ADP-ribose pyrophosphatase
MTNWKKIDEKITKVGFRKIITKKFILPNGKEADFDIVGLGKTAAVLALTSDNKVILAKQYRPGPEKELLELPGGSVDENETPLEAGKRELLEETGYTGDFEEVGFCNHSAYSEVEKYAFIAKNCKKIQEPQLGENEFVEVTFLTLDEFKKLIRSGQMTDIQIAYMAMDRLGLL